MQIYSFPIIIIESNLNYRRTEYAQDDVQGRSSFAPTFVPGDRQDQHWHRPAVVHESYANTAFSHGGHPQFAVPAEHVERHVPPGYREQRGAIWVD